jgi:hypothetical protein
MRAGAYTLCPNLLVVHIIVDKYTRTLTLAGTQWSWQVETDARNLSLLKQIPKEFHGARPAAGPPRVLHFYDRT